MPAQPSELQEAVHQSCPHCGQPLLTAEAVKRVLGEREPGGEEFEEEPESPSEAALRSHDVRIPMRTI